MGYVGSSSDLPVILITKQDVNPMALDRYPGRGIPFIQTRGPGGFVANVFGRIAKSLKQDLEFYFSFQ